MRFLPLFFDTSSGVFILVGSGEAALAKLRLLRAAGAYVRWFSCSIDVAEELSTSPGKGKLEISVGDPLKADLSDVVAIVSAAGELLDRHSPRARGANAFQSMSSTVRICRPSFFPPSSIAARWSSPSAPVELPRFWRSACVNGSKRCFPRGSASLPN